MSFSFICSKFEAFYNPFNYICRLILFGAENLLQLTYFFFIKTEIVVSVFNSRIIIRRVEIQKIRIVKLTGEYIFIVRKNRVWATIKTVATTEIYFVIPQKKKNAKYAHFYQDFENKKS